MGLPHLSVHSQLMDMCHIHILGTTNNGPININVKDFMWT